MEIKQMQQRWGFSPSVRIWLPSLILAIAAHVQPASALVRTFTGTTSNDWLVSTNWNPEGIPEVGDDVTIPAGLTASLSSPATIKTLKLSGTLRGGGELSVSGLIQWSEGTMTGSGATNANGGIEITGLLPKTLDRNLNNSGAATWSDSGNLGMGGTFRNLAGAVFTITTDRTITSLFPGARFENLGTVVSTTASQRTAINVAFNNSGVVNVLGGTLALAGGGTSSGSFHLNGGRLELGGGTHTFSEASTIEGGPVLFSAGTIRMGASYQATATSMTNGNATFTGNILSTGPIAIANGTMTFNNVEGQVSTASLSFAAGTLSGTSNISISGATTWSGGSMGGTGVTNAIGSLSIDGTASKLLDRTLNLRGSGTWSSAGNLAIGGKLNILAGATFELLNDRGFLNMGSNAKISNAGTFRKTEGMLTTISGIPFENSGVVEVLSGVLSLNPTYLQTAGVTRLAAGTTLRSIQDVRIDGGQLEGSGTIDASLTSNAQILPGPNAGRITVTQEFRQNGNGKLSVDLGGTTSGAFDQLVVAGAANLAGAIDINLLPGFTPQLGDQFPILSFVSFTGDSLSINGLILGVGRGLTKVLNPTSLVLQYGVEDCSDSIDNDHDGSSDCADPKCAAAMSCQIVPTPTPCSTGCVGDCSCDGIVSFMEILGGIELALTDESSSPCLSLDADSNDTIEVEEIVSAVTNADNPCGRNP